ncbi:amidinotransferase [Actinocatenispora sera]|uniref:Amidinotransferase n=1 Tax=Actinocatenispora sera TaxID=390989 RepID=A0A810KX54_9ACTN|nr:amidinotransferase [Actinocatenispora sera]
MIDTPRAGQYEVVPADSPLAAPATAAPRPVRTREYLMCPPEHFAVEYAINPWMHPEQPVDTELAVKQWYGLRETLTRLGHTVHVLDPQSSLPDMVYAANGAFVVDGAVYGARFRYQQRRAEAGYHRAWYLANGWSDFHIPEHTNEGEGDFAYLPAVPGMGGVVLAGYGFRTAIGAHAEAQEALARPVVSLHLTDPRFYHLDTALASIDDATVAYYPGAFSAASQRVLRQLFPDALLADEADALAFGLNVVSDNRHVVLNSTATGMIAKLAARGYEPVPVELTELHRGGGSVKCCIAELRR